MMECQICGDKDGPWEIADTLGGKGKIKQILVCETCAEMIRQFYKEELKNKLIEVNIGRWEKK